MLKTEKIRYELDPWNRLVLGADTAEGALTKFRRVLDGRFETDGLNNLSYHVKAPLSKDENIPHQIKLKGEWSLTDDHRLRLTLDKWGRKTFGDELTLQGEILDVNENSLLFAVTTRTKDDTRSTYVLNLAGVWKADEFNRLSFHVRKEKGACDILTFNGAWEINKDHEIIYEYDKADLIKKKRAAHTLTFKGYWDIKDKCRISYLLGGSTDSSFVFGASAGLFKEDYIQYQVGIGASAAAGFTARTITLSGAWNLKRDTGLTFEVEYEDGKVHAIIFGADARLTDRDMISFRLKDGAGNKDIGASLELSHKILGGDGEAFVRLLGSRGEAAIYAGAAWGW